MLCYVVMLYYVILYFVMLCCVVLCYVMLRYVVLCCVVLRCIALHYINMFLKVVVLNTLNMVNLHICMHSLIISHKQSLVYGHESFKNKYTSV